MDQEICSKSAPNCECFSCNKLSKPILNSTKRHKNQIEQIKIASHSAPNKNAEVDFDKQKLTSKLNFGVHQKVFRNLTPINVNDSLLLPKEKLPIPKKYGNDKIPVPDLHDFLDDVSPAKYVIPEPEIKVKFMEYDFDVVLNYKLFKA